MIKIKKINKGFAILFSVTLSAILFAIAVGVINVAYKELKFSTSARATNEAFFAADTGLECALIHDKSENSVFIESGGETNLTCLGSNEIELIGSYPYWEFYVPGLGENGQSCAKVSVAKVEDINNDPPEPTVTRIVAKGYNIGGDNSDCSSTNPDRVERELETRY